MQAETMAEATRQIEICNACRYCEGYCSVFPAMTRQRAFSAGDITHLANLCHNCRGCYYACQFTEPHEFALNLPRALAEVRQESWQDAAWPSGLASAFHRQGVLISAVLVASFALILSLSLALRPSSGEGFYAYMSHGLMVAIFLPAFLLPALAVAISLRRNGAQIGGPSIGFADLLGAFKSAGRMKNLDGGHGEGCNFEDEDRFTKSRLWAHHATVWGFLLCFASTSSGTVLHYLFDSPAPYGFFSAPKLFGVSGGLLLCAGTGWLGYLKTQADPNLSVPKIWGGEMAFIGLLFAVSATGLLLYWATGTGAVALLLPVHLAFVLTFFLLTPYSKMAHGFYRLAALAKEEALKRRSV